MRALCPRCRKEINLVREISSDMGSQYRFHKHGPVKNRCWVGNNRFFLHELNLADVRRKEAASE